MKYCIVFYCIDTLCAIHILLFYTDYFKETLQMILPCSEDVHGFFFFFFFFFFNIFSFFANFFNVENLINFGLTTKQFFTD